MTSPSAADEFGGVHSIDIIPDSRLVGHPLLLMLDVDGTLAPIAPHPSLARVPTETRQTIASLATRRGVSVVLVSGRAAHDARRLVAVEGVWTVGNHGAEVMDPDGNVTVDPEVAPFAQAMARTARTLEPLLAPLRNVVLENKGWTLSVHYRMADELVVPRLRDVVEGVVAQNGLRMTEGKMVLEVRPPVRVDKGTAIYRLARDLGGLTEHAALLFAGDDATDEDAFRLLRSRVPRAITVHIGPDTRTAAEFTLGTPNDMHALLQRVALLNRQER